jgi:phage/plasmid-associated DNA primase
VFASGRTASLIRRQTAAPACSPTARELVAARRTFPLNSAYFSSLLEPLQQARVRLRAKLPSILYWAITGWRRLIERGYFVMPASSGEELGSPIGAFIRERCVVAPARAVETSRFFESWCDWSKQQGRDHPGTAQTFGRDLAPPSPASR